MPSVTALSKMSDRALANLLENAGTLNISGITFTEANDAADSKFEPSVNLDDLLSNLIEVRGVAGAIDALKVNGNEADGFKLVWDHLDDNYTYYNTNVNDAFIDLGIAYANYLKDGGAPLDNVVKFQADNGDADLVPERMQSLHDNILGNFDELSIVDKFGAGSDAILDRIDDAGLGALIGVRGDYADGRGIYGGYDHQDPTQTVQFDQGYFFL